VQRGFPELESLIASHVHGARRRIPKSNCADAVVQIPREWSFNRFRQVRWRDSNRNADRKREHRCETQEGMLDEHAERELYIEPGKVDRVQESKSARRSGLRAIGIDVAELAARLVRRFVFGQSCVYEIRGPHREVMLELRVNLGLDGVTMADGAENGAHSHDQQSSAEGKHSGAALLSGIGEAYVVSRISARRAEQRTRADAFNTSRSE
jgi:hypothetical protein